MKIKSIAQLALASAASVLNQWCGGGRVQGREYVTLNPTRADSKPGSFSINLDTGAWADFATGDKGGDLVALVAYLDHVKMNTAAGRIANFLGLNTLHSPVESSLLSASPLKNRNQKNADWVPFQPIPEDAPPPPDSHSIHGAPSSKWAYKNQAGRILCYVYRFDCKTENQKKQFAPLTYCEAKNNKREWRWRALPELRPLFNLDQIHSRPDDVVIVCEGEKSACAVADFYPAGVATTMLNGAQAPAKTDWSPLKGRTVWLWPDNDEPGRKCMKTVESLLYAAQVHEIYYVNLQVFGQSLPEKFDAADLLADGMDYNRFINYVNRSDFLLSINKQSLIESVKSEDTKTATFHIADDGVYYFGYSDHGNDSPPIWICSKLEVTAITRDIKNESWGRLLEFSDPDGKRHAWAMPMELLKGDGAEYRGHLLSMGLLMSTGTKARNLLTQYIQTSKTENKARCVERTGWFDGVFVLPHLSIGDSDERVLFQSANNQAHTFRASRTLNDWQLNVSMACKGHTRLLFAISTAFAAPLIEVMGMESGGFHFRGNSSSGKTTALRVAASVWGGPDYMQRWRATDNGLEAVAVNHSDCLLLLDELSQVDSKVAGEVAYMLANGAGKVRAERSGARRSAASWRLLFLSSGEAGLSEHMALAGKKTKAGQEVRLLDIPADAGDGFGIFNSLGPGESGAALSTKLMDATSKCYGVAAIEFLNRLVTQRHEIASRVKAYQKAFISKNVKDGASGQVNRAAYRFALVAAAGEIATEWNITGWDTYEAGRAAETCFKSWLEQRGGNANQEHIAILSQVRRFFELHGESRFTDWTRPVSDDSHAAKTINRAGYRKHSSEKDDKGNLVYTDEFDINGAEKVAKMTEFFVFKEAFEQEVCAGFDYKVVCRLLLEKGILIPETTDGKGFTRKERLPGGEATRCYRINASVFNS